MLLFLVVFSTELLADAQRKKGRKVYLTERSFCSKIAVPIYVPHTLTIPVEKIALKPLWLFSCDVAVL